MKNVLPILIVTLSLSCVVFAQQQPQQSHSHSTVASAPSSGMAAFASGLGTQHHPVTTQNARAQQLFDEGLRLIYAFNHDEAERSFKRAAELDPNLAMAYWGIAYAVGPNYNLPVDGEREKAAYDALQKAQSLSAKASDSEKAYINALAKRYSNEPNPDLKQLSLNYRDAMRSVMQQYPDDLDAA